MNKSSSCYSRWLFSWPILCFGLVEAFQVTHHSIGGNGMITSTPTTARTTVTRLFEQQPEHDNNDDSVVEVGTKEYYSGFISSPIQDETVAERGTGLEQALKLAGSVVVVLVALVVGFMASNGLL